MGRGSLRRHGLTALVALAALLALPAAAQADSTVTVGGGSIVLTATPGDINDIEITNPVGGQVFLEERTSGIDMLDGEAGAQCSQVGFGQVSCTVPSLISIVVLLEDENDSLDASSVADSVRAEGGAGNDILLTGDANDSIVGGLGSDGHDGGGGNDTVEYSDAARSESVNVDLANLSPSGDVNGEDGTGDSLVGIENVVGTDESDVLSGSSEDNEFEPGLGADEVDGEGGTDLVNYAARSTDLVVDLSASPSTGNGDAGAGAEDGVAGDTLEDVEDALGGSGADVMTGSDAPNFFFSNDGADTINSGDGADRIYSYRGADNIDAGADVDFVGAQADDDFVDGGGGNDVLLGGDEFTVVGTGEDVLSGSGGDDVLVGGDGDDAGVLNGVEGLDGGAGDDEIRGGPGADVMTGGADADELDYRESPVGVAVDLGAQTVSGGDAAGDAIDGTFEDIEGSDFADQLTGSGGANVILGGGEADTLAGLAGNDTLDGGMGNDLASYATEPATTADLGVLGVGGSATNSDGADDLEAIEDLEGGAGNDDLTGDANDNSLTGLGGDDTLAGAEGDDTVEGGAGDDALLPGPGTDSADGEADDDTVSYADSPDSRVLINVSDSTFEGIPSDTVYELPVGTQDAIPNVENAIGSENMGLDYFVGDSGANRYEGPAGNDTVFARGGEDTLVGGDGLDQLYAESGDDLMTGGPDSQIFEGGIGIDTVSYANAPQSISADIGNGTSNDGENISASDDFDGIENLVATPNDGDFVVGSSGANSIDLGSGDNDLALPAGGDDTVNGGPGDGDGVSFQNSGSDGVNASLLAGTSTGPGHGTDSLIGLERMNGSNFGDTLTGSGSANQLYGLAGNDTLNGLGGDDFLSGFQGADTLIGRAGTDDLVGGPDADSASYADAAGPVTASLGTASLDGTASNDGDGGSDGTIIQIEILTGSENADTLTGGGESRTINALGGDDLLLLRNAGPDIADCGAGTDRANTDAADTQLTGCERADGPGGTATPQITGSTPASGGNENSPRIQGTSVAGSIVTLYSSPDCSGAPLANGSRADFGVGFEVTVADNTSTTFSASAENGDIDGPSACSPGFTYTEVTPPSVTPDTTPPAVKINGDLGKTKDTTPSFSFSSEAGARFECRVDKGAFATCRSPYTAKKLGKGKHTFSVRAIDAAGNVGAASSDSFTVKKKKKKK